MILYRLLSIIFAPFIIVYIFFRALLGREDQARIAERFGIASRPRPSSEIIWINAVSVGETNSALILLDELLKTYPKIAIIFTTTSLTSAKLLADRINSHKIYANRVIHQFLPVDSYFCVKGFLSYWRPKLALFVESEIWPNFINQCQKTNCKLVLINGRISDKSFKKWQLAKNLGFKIFDQLTMIFAQSANDKKNFEGLTNQEIFDYGNLKSAANCLEYDEQKLNELSSQIKDRTIWFAASTHEGEEEIIFNIHQKLKTAFNNILTIIAPRHPKRADKITSIATSNNLNLIRRSLNQTIQNQTDIYLADTLGELGLFYQLCQIAFIGGSLIDNIGGHNPFEAAKLNCCIISGKYTPNNQEAYQKLLAADGCFIVENEANLQELIKQLFIDPNAANLKAQNAYNLVKSTGDIAKKIINKLDELIKP
jgi:3-deoxy-D-manno-octulosonic-acid transferase